MKFLYLLKVYLYFLAELISRAWREKEEIPAKILCERGHELASKEICLVSVLKTPECGHSAQMPCFLPEEDWVCREVVSRLRESCGHSVTIQCGEKKGAPCTVICKKLLPCGHESKGLYLCSEEIIPERCLFREREILPCSHSLYRNCGESWGDKRCRKRLDKKLPHCEHEVTLYCFQDVATQVCPVCKDEPSYAPVGESQEKVKSSGAVKCAHGIIVPSRPEEIKCTAPCFKLLPCSHLCKKTCHSDENHDCHCLCSKRCPRGHLCPDRHPCTTPCKPCKENVNISYEDCSHKDMVWCFTISDSDPICKRLCPFEMKCGHDCKRPCSHHKNRQCPPCTENSHCVPLPCKHVCRVPCAQHDAFTNGGLICPPCQESIKTCKYGHTSAIGCSITGPEVDNKCMVLDSKEFELACGKKELLDFYCRERKDVQLELRSLEMHTAYCTSPCGATFTEKASCGHTCPGQCSDCFKSVLHERCSEPCGKVLPCFHQCTVPCSENCSPCKLPCENECDHTKCEEICGLACRACQEPCTYQCEHLQCTRLCYQPCDRGPCLVPCPKTLSCGHNCMGFCGEICPDLCRVCDPAKIESDFKGRARYIQLPCGDILPEKVLSLTFSSPGNNPLCPLCSKVIYNCKRYSLTLYKFKITMMRAKLQLHGTEKAILESQLRAWDFLQPQHQVQNKSYRHLVPFKELIREKLVVYDLSYLHYSVSMKRICFQEAESLEYLALLHRNLVLKLCSLEDNKVPEDFSRIFLDRALKLIGELSSRRLPLYHQEILDIKRESQRLLDLYRLLLLKSPTTDRLCNVSVESRFNAGLKILTSPGYYTDSDRGNYFENLTGIVNDLLPVHESPDFSYGGDEQKMKFLSYNKILT